jgi:ATP-dependent DNA helicase DinG
MLETEAGDVSELAALGEDDPVLGAVTSSSDTRLGASCQHFDECFVTKMKRAADSAQIVVVNHHLFFADLALRGAHPGRVLPDYDAVVFDEAHQLEDIATTFFGVRLSEARVARILRDVEHALSRLSPADALPGAAILQTARVANLSFWETIAREGRAQEGRATLERDFWTGERQARFHALDDALDAVRALAESVKGRLDAPGSSLVPSRRDALALVDALEVGGRRATEARTDLSTIVDGAAGRVTWLDTSARSTSLSSSPVDLSLILRTRVFESVPAAILTSATLSSGKNGDTGPKAFSFIRSRLGLDADSVSVREEVVASPFDYTTHALLYVPTDLPAPADPAFLDGAAARIAELIEITGGGAFVLTTSLRSMRALHGALVERLPGRRILVQGEAPKTTTLSTFRAAGDAVLVATASFWQGVDVPGDALRLVILEKIPFPVPNEPVILARAQALEAEGKKPFVDLHVPLAKIALKQGFGRLIRTRQDRGIVALLDERVHRRGYGKDLLAALPPAARATELDEVRSFWNHVSAARSRDERSMD